MSNMSKITVLGKLKSFCEKAGFELGVNGKYAPEQYTQEAHCAFLTSLLLSEGFIEPEGKEDVFSLLAMDGVGLVNHSQCKQFAQKQGLFTKPSSEANTAARTAARYGL